MYCRGCGVHAPDDANFCVSCGSDLRSFYDDDGEGDPALDDPTLDDLEPVGSESTDGSDESAPGTSSTETRTVPPVNDGSRRDLLKECPACGSPNSSRRYLCGSCGADLDSGEWNAPTAIVPNPSSGARVRHETTTEQLEGRGSDRRWRLAGTIVLAGLVIGGGLGAMIVLGVGPFATDGETDDSPVFDRASYPDDPAPLTVSTVAASTSQDASSDDLDAGQLLDGDLTTAWNSRGEVKPDGVGEIIEIEFPSPVWLSAVVFANGDQEDDEAFVANARAKRIRVELEGGSSFIANLLDEQGEQAVRLPTPRFATGARFEVLEVYPGDTYDDLALSEIGFHGHVANEDDAAVAGSEAN